VPGMRAGLFIVMLSACGAVSGNQTDDPMDSGVADDSGVPVDANPCVGGGMVQLCLAALPREPLTIDANREIDTDRDSRCAAFTPAGPGAPANQPWCVIASTTLTIARGATLSATGARALVLVALESVQIDGTLDVASRVRPRRRGAGSQPADCTPAGGGNGQGGGAGGSFTSRGGNGGAAPAPQAGSGGIAGSPVQATRFRGGCRGGNGGFVDPIFGGDPGEGGGAVYVIAPAITVSETGAVNASGAGGSSTSDSQVAGGGGGSGGMIGIEASTLVLRTGARVFANGGGGGEGAGCGAPGRGAPGANGQDPVSPIIAALGGRMDPEGGNGGNGAISNIVGEVGAAGILCSGGSGGGGGGGGVGAVVLRGAVSDQGAQISPPPMTM
jgi:hypothetical protein